VAVLLDGSPLTASFTLAASGSVTWTSPVLTAGDILVMVVDMNGTSAFPASGSPTGGTGLSWTSIVTENNTAAHFSSVRAWWSPIPSTQTPASISTAITASGGSVSASGVLYRLFGADSVAPVGQVGVFQGQTDPTGTALQITGTLTGSMIFLTGSDWSAGSAARTITISGVGTSTTDLDALNSTDFRAIVAHGDQSASTNQGTLDYTAATGDWAASIFEIKAASGVTASPTAVRAQPGATWKRQFKHRQLRLPDPPVAVPTAPDFVPTAMTRRRWNRRMLPLLPSGSAVSPVGAQTPPPRPRTVRVTRRRFLLAANGPDSFSPPSGQVRVPPQNRRRLLRPRLPVDGDSYSPPPNQTTPVVNPPISQTVTRALRRWGLRRDGTSVTPVPVQVAAPTNPSITQVTSGRVRRIGVLLRRPGAATPTVQQGVVLPVQPRRAGFRFRRRPQAVAPVLVQVAAPVNPTTTQFGSLWVKRWGLRRYGRVSNPTPGQQTAPTNPPITQLGSLWAKRWGLRRYGRVSNPTPAQQTAPTNPAITALTAVRARVGARALRRGKVSNPIPAQQAAVTAPPLTQLTVVRGRAVVHGAPRRPQAAAPPIPQATPPTVTTERRGLLRVRRARPRVAVQPPPQAAPPVQMEHRPPRLRRMLRRLGFPIQGGTAPTSTAVSTIGSLGATATDLGSVTGPDGTGAGGGSVGLGGVAGADETGQTGGSGMTGSAQ
jgi:hypothetical protein